MKNNILFCPSCFEKFNPKTDKRSAFIKNKVQCSNCKRWIDNKDKITKKVKIKMIETEYLKNVKPPPKYSAKYIPASVYAENAHNDVIHYCKPDYYKYDMRKAIGREV